MNLVAYLGQNELAGLRFENTMDHTIHEYPTNNVFVAIGQVSQNDLFKSLVETDDHGFIITNDKMETSLPGLFAIGDTRKKDVRQVASAVGDASVASVFIDKYLMINNRVG
jgi:thioredoxin reductase (NADPH)